MKRIRLSKQAKDKLAIKVARLKLVDRLPVDEIVKRHDLPYKAMVSRLINYAQDNNLFTIEFSDPGLQVKRKPKEEEKLKEVFSLNGAIVVEIEEQKKMEAGKRGDMIHDLLGQSLGLELKDHLERFPPTSIGVGGGRGPFFFAKALLENPPKLNQSSEIKILSLTGTVSADVWDQEKKSVDRCLLLDSRDVVNILGKGLKANSKNLHRLDLPLAFYAEEKDKIWSLKSTQFLREENWKDQKPELAIVGIGALTGGHRFLHYQTIDLKPIEDNLERLIPLVKQAEKKVKFCPVGDICNRLFLINPETLKKSIPAIYKKLKTEIEAINAVILTVELDQLREVRNVIGIAGGKEAKAQAIFNALEQNVLNILCTDAKTATAILQLKAKKNKRNPL